MNKIVLVALLSGCVENLAASARSSTSQLPFYEGRQPLDDVLEHVNSHYSKNAEERKILAHQFFTLAQKYAKSEKPVADVQLQEEIEKLRTTGQQFIEKSSSELVKLKSNDIADIGRRERLYFFNGSVMKNFDGMLQAIGAWLGKKEKYVDVRLHITNPFNGEIEIISRNPQLIKPCAHVRLDWY